MLKGNAGADLFVQSGGKVYGKTSVNSRDLDLFGILTAYTYTRTETTPNYVGTTYRINAAQPIKIRTTNKADSTINVTNEGNIIIDGDLGTGANGTVNLTSQFGNITTSADGKITDAKINLDAHENIDVTPGLPESKATDLKATTFDNDVKITANTPLKNLDISAGMFLGGKKATVIGTGDINGKIAASDLDITTPGNIDITAQLSGKLNATGDNSVTVTQTSGDLKIGKVASKGDVSITASDGAIINAVDSVFNMTGAADKINAWRAAGLISDKDSADSATNSAREEKAIRLQGLENLFKRWALKDDGTVDQMLYRRFISNTADTTNLTDEQISQLKLYQDLKTSTDYGFSRNQLLYAIQEGLINPKAGLTADVGDPIITGKNITLNAKSIGKELAPRNYSDFTNIKTLEKLAGVKGGDVTLNRNGSITVTEQSPITVNAAGDINITADANLSVKNITSGSNVNVNAKGDIVPTDEDTRVTAPNVNITATNDIATQANPLNIKAENTALRAKYAYIIGDYGNLNAAGTNVESLNRASGGEETPIFSTPTINRPVSNTATNTATNTAVESLLTPNSTLLTGIAPPVDTAKADEYRRMAQLLRQSTTLMSKSGEVYVAAARAWLSGMGYNEAEKLQIINLAKEMSFDNLSSTKLLNDGIAEIVAKYSGYNLTALY